MVRLAEHLLDPNFDPPNNANPPITPDDEVCAGPGADGTTIQDAVEAANNADQVVLALDGVPDGSKQPEQRRALAIRLRDGLAIGPLPANFKIADPSGSADGPQVKVIQPARGLMIAALPADSAPARTASVVDNFIGYVYVAVVELAKGGPTATPMFIGRVDAQNDPRWGAELLVPGGSATLPVGSFVFLLDGRFVGLVVKMPEGPPAIAPAALVSASLDLMGGSGTEGAR